MDIWYQVAIYTVDQAPAILDAFAQWRIIGAWDLKVIVALIIGLEATMVGLIYSGAADKPAILRSDCCCGGCASHRRHGEGPHCHSWEHIFHCVGAVTWFRTATAATLPATDEVKVRMIVE